jgi:hypothetical protein
VGIGFTRTIWFATFGLALLGGLFTTNLVFAPSADRSAVAELQLAAGNRSPSR